MRFIYALMLCVPLALLSSGANAADKTVKCTCGDKKFEGTCSADKAPQCDCKSNSVKCNEPTVKNDKKDEKKK